MIMKIEASFVGMTATQLILSRASAVNGGKQIINEKSHKALFKGNELLALLFMWFSSFCMLGPLRKWACRDDISALLAVGTDT